MRYRLSHLLILTAAIAAIIVSTRYAMRLDGLALLIVAANLLIFVILPASTLATAVGVWRRKRRLALVGGSVLGAVVGLLAGTALSLLLEYGVYLLDSAGIDWLSSRLTIETRTLAVLPAIAALGIAGGYWTTSRVLNRRG